MSARRSLRCWLGIHEWSTWHEHASQCVFVTDTHLIRACLRCSKIQSRFTPRKVDQ